MNRRIITYLFLCFILSLSASGQQGNNWYFGNFAGITFNTNPPSALTNGALDTKEGCASISDKNGQLLFYTDGIYVWNRLHQVMPNGSGLKGDPSASNSAIIIPKPGDNNIFYIFTADASENANLKGYNYSEVDMALNGGLGDVTTSKNILLHTPSSEQLTAVRHANGIDIWVITDTYFENKWFAYKVDCNGVNTTPVISACGHVRDSTEQVFYDATWHTWNSDAVGCLKTSPDGKKLATVLTRKKIVEIFDFNNATGIISNPIAVSQNRPYGLEFSPDSKLLYVSSEEAYNFKNGYIVQYDATLSDSASITNSAITIGTAPDGLYLSGLQLGPDNKIYCTLPLDMSLAVINSPNTVGTGCNYVNRQVDLNGRFAQRCLPVFFPALITNQNADFDFTVNNNCSGVNFSGKSTITGTLTWKWDFGDGTTATGQNVTHTYPPAASNIYTVTLTVTTNAVCGGKAEAVKKVNLNRITPVTNFGFKTACGDLTVAFSDSSTVTGGTLQNWLWDFGDGTNTALQNPSHTYTAAGNYTVSLSVTSSGNCNATTTLQKVVTIDAKPVSFFTNTASCAGKAIQFTDKSTIAAGNIIKWFWDLGDGTTTSLQSPSKTYASVGDYTISLVTTSGNGCISDTFKKTISVSSIPVADFSVSNICAGQVTQFKNQSSISNGIINSWYWNLGDGVTVSANDVNHQYALPKSYTVKLSVTSANGCVADTVIKSVTIGSKPVADFSFITSCGNKIVSFKDNSTNSNEALANWYWNFNDDNTASKQNNDHTYNLFGDYNVKLVAVSSLGCASDTITKLVEVNAKPLAAFGFSNGCINSPVSFTNSSSVEKGTITKYWWQLGNTNSLLKSPVNAYNQSGAYTIKLVTTSDKNCISDTTAQTLTIETKPFASISAPDGCTGTATNLQNNSTISYGTIEKHWWSFGDGNTANTQKPSYTYSQYGNYNIKYVAISKNGCVSDTAAAPVLIESVPVVDFSFGISCAGKPVQITNNSSNSFGNIIQWNWDFNNGNSSTDFEPGTTYNQYGNYQVKLKATTKNGCNNTATKALNVSRVNVFVGNDTIAAIGQPLQLNATGAAAYEWTPPNYLNNPLINNPVATLPGNFTYKLKGTTTEGCVGYDTINIKAYKGPEVYVPNAFTPNSDGVNDVFKPILVGIKELVYFKVYNRWGQEVYNNNIQGYGWDGKQNGVLLPSGVYVWFLKSFDYLGKKIEKKGTVLLIK